LIYESYTDFKGLQNIAGRAKKFGWDKILSEAKNIIDAGDFYKPNTDSNKNTENKNTDNVNNLKNENTNLKNENAALKAQIISLQNKINTKTDDNNPHKIFGYYCVKNFTQSELRIYFNRICKIYHPDKRADKSDVDFKNFHNAYEKIKDEF
jgi:hypothetical protein